MAKQPLKVYAEGWKSDADMAKENPEYLRAAMFFEHMLERARLASFSEIDIANALFNQHILVLAKLGPDNAQVSMVAELFVKAVLQLRDHDPATLDDQALH